MMLSTVNVRNITAFFNTIHHPLVVKDEHNNKTPLNSISLNHINLKNIYV